VTVELVGGVLALGQDVDQEVEVTEPESGFNLPSCFFLSWKALAQGAAGELQGTAQL
jgi:hypothetical protein